MKNEKKNVNTSLNAAYRFCEVWQILGGFERFQTIVSYTEFLSVVRREKRIVLDEYLKDSVFEGEIGKEGYLYQIDSLYLGDLTSSFYYMIKAADLGYYGKTKEEFIADYKSFHSLK